MFQNYFNKSLTFVLFTSSLFFLSCKPSSTHVNSDNFNMTGLYSPSGDEYQVEFKAILKTNDIKISEIKDMTDQDKKYFENYELKETLKYLFGPLTHRNIAGIRTKYKIEVDWSSARSEGDRVVLDYTYKGTWIVAKIATAMSQLTALPLPFSHSNIITPSWKKCTDSYPDHQTESFFWYYWDPKRPGCDHALNQEYQIVQAQLSNITVPELLSYPEYDELLKSGEKQNNLQMTFAFGYVEDEEDANPDISSDYGMREYRSFIKFMDTQNISLKFKKSPILLSEYFEVSDGDKAIGYRYVGLKDGVTVEVKVVTASDIDQMDLFAKSYAQDHDGFFSWYGHSRLGSGFDAQQFKSTVARNPELYSISPNYQIVYWAGCNSYSYYTMPFFEMKAVLDPVADPSGTKKLDIISNALPSLFSFNADNAKIAYKALINWKQKTSYQQMLTEIESHARWNGYTVLVNVLGDEDNAEQTK